MWLNIERSKTRQSQQVSLGISAALDLKKMSDIYFAHISDSEDEARYKKFKASRIASSKDNNNI